MDITAKTLNTNLVVNSITGKVGDNITIQSTIKDSEGFNITGGKVVFKVNGITLKDTTSTILYVPVVNGIAQLNYIIPSSWSKNNSVIQVIYSGVKDKYDPCRTSNTINVTKKTAELNITVNKNITKSTDNVTFTTIVKDINGTLLNDGQIIIKFQGKTIKDINGNTIKANVTNGIATLNYTIPNGISAHTYNISATYLNPEYYEATNITKLTTEKLNTGILLNSLNITKNNSTTKLIGVITDSNGNLPVGTTKISVKINGLTISHLKITNGIINNTITIPYTLKRNTYTITVISATNNAYIGDIRNTTLTVVKSS